MMLAQPPVNAVLGLDKGRHDRPQRIVEVEGDGADGHGV
jgi:hypothetical protein